MCPQHLYILLDERNILFNSCVCATLTMSVVENIQASRGSLVQLSSPLLKIPPQSFVWIGPYYIKV